MVPGFRYLSEIIENGRFRSQILFIDLRCPAMMGTHVSCRICLGLSRLARM